MYMRTHFFPEINADVMETERSTSFLTLLHRIQIIIFFVRVLITLTIITSPQAKVQCEANQFWWCIQRSCNLSYSVQIRASQEVFRSKKKSRFCVIKKHFKFLLQLFEVVLTYFQKYFASDQLESSNKSYTCTIREIIEYRNLSIPGSVPGYIFPLQPSVLHRKNSYLAPPTLSHTQPMG